MVKNILFIALISMISLFTNTISAQTIADCGGLKGKAYYYSGGSVSEGWKEDGFSGKRGIRILHKEGEQYDIFYGTPPNGKSVLQYGGMVSLATKNNNIYQVLAIDPIGLLELYLFDLNTKTMTLSQHSTRLPEIKTGTYIAKCK